MGIFDFFNRRKKNKEKERSVRRSILTIYEDCAWCIGNITFEGKTVTIHTTRPGLLIGKSGWRISDAVGTIKAEEGLKLEIKEINLWK